MGVTNSRARSGKKQLINLVDVRERELERGRAPLERGGPFRWI